MGENTNVDDTPPTDSLGDAMRALADQWRLPSTEVDKKRARYRRPGPKCLRDRFERSPRGGHGRIPPIPQILIDLELPPRLFTDPPPQPAAPDGHPFGGCRSFYFNPAGERIERQPGEPENDWLIRATCAAGGPNRVARTTLFHRGARAIVSTVFLGVSLADPPVLFETALYVGNQQPGSRGLRIVSWQYETRAAAIRGHGLVTQTLRCGWGHLR